MSSEEMVAISEMEQFIYHHRQALSTFRVTRRIQTQCLWMWCAYGWLCSHHLLTPSKLSSWSPRITFTFNMSSAASTVEHDVEVPGILQGWTREANAKADLMLISSDNYGLWMESKALAQIS